MIDTTADRHPIDLLAEEFVARFRHEDLPSITEYAQRYPELADEIRTIFPTIVEIEQLKRRRLNGDAAPALPAPEWLGDCRIIREVGRGGMGIVYEAEQKSLGRRVAVKVLTAAAMLTPNHMRRFLHEAQTMARLHHTNIVPVFEVGEHEGLPFYVMQFIEGRGLDSAIAEAHSRQPDGKLPSQSQVRNPSFRDVARIGLQAAEALAYAHAQGTLHRDVKPSNLILDARGTVWVTDFGLAKRLEQDDLTGPGETAGTLRYMPPERFEAHSDVRSDVYSLGLTLYELLTLRPAFDESDHGRLLQQVTCAKPPAPRKCDPSIPRDLETVVQKALARDPAQRYQTAEELAADLRRFLEDKPVQARRVTPTEQLRRWCRRNPAIASLTAVAASLLVLVAAVATVGYVHAHQAFEREANLHTQAETQQQRAEANLELAMRAFEEIFEHATRRGAGPGTGSGVGDHESELAYPIVVSPDDMVLLQNLLKFYDRFGERNQSDPRLQREIARGYQRVGDIQQRFGQFEKAEAAYRRALTLYEARTDEFPRGVVDTREISAARNDLGLVLQMTGRFEEAERTHRQALYALARMGNSLSRFELVRTHALLGNLQWRIGQAEASEINHRRALLIIEPLLKENSKNPEYKLAKARSNRSLYLALSSRGKHGEAFAAHHRAITILENLVQSYPNVPDYRYELSDVLMSAYVPRFGPRRNPDADEQLSRAVELAKNLATAFPAVPQYQALRARALQRLGASLQVSARAEEAEPHLRESVTLNRSLVAQFPSVPTYQLYLAEACQSLSTILFRDDKLAETCALLQEATTAQQAYLKTAPRNRFAWFVLASQYQTLSDVLRKQGESAEAAKVAQKAAEARKGR